MLELLNDAMLVRERLEHLNPDAKTVPGLMGIVIEPAEDTFKKEWLRTLRKNIQGK